MSQTRRFHYRQMWIKKSCLLDCHCAVLLSDFNISYAFCLFLQLSEDIGYVLYSALGSFYIPSCIMVFVYIRIYFAARARTRRAMENRLRRHNPGNSAGNQPNPNETQVPLITVQPMNHSTVANSTEVSSQTGPYREDWPSLRMK